MPEPDLLSGSAWPVPHLPNTAQGREEPLGAQNHRQGLITLLPALTDEAERLRPSNSKCIARIQGWGWNEQCFYFPHLEILKLIFLLCKFREQMIRMAGLTQKLVTSTVCCELNGQWNSAIPWGLSRISNHLSLHGQKSWDATENHIIKK